MKKIVVEITGTTPLLMNNPSGMTRGNEGGKKQIPSAEEEALRSRYLMPDGSGLALKSDHIHSCLKEASKGFRLTGRQQVWPYIAGSIEVMPDWIPLTASEYTIDTRRCVLNKKQGVLRSRAMVWPWAATFELLYDDTVFADTFMDKTLRNEILHRAGTGIGLLDYRPMKGGKYGRFTVTRWER